MQRRITCVLLWAMGLPLSAQVWVRPDPLLDRIRRKAQANLLRMPDYICLETVERERRPRPEAAFEPVDTIRLQVCVAGDKELVSWPDSARLEQKVLPAGPPGHAPPSRLNLIIPNRPATPSALPSPSSRATIRLERTFDGRAVPS